MQRGAIHDASTSLGMAERGVRHVTIVVLAAGFSRRLGHPKQLVMFEGETLLHRAARIAREACDDVVIVTRQEFVDVVGGQASPPVQEDEGDRRGRLSPHWRVVLNDHAEEGIASSIRLGVAACDGAVLLMLCDQPHITAAHLRALIDGDAPLVATGYAGVAGVPALFGAEYREPLLALRGDRGAQSLLKDAVIIPFEDAAIDVDQNP